MAMAPRLTRDTPSLCLRLFRLYIVLPSRLFHRARGEYGRGNCNMIRRLTTLFRSFRETCTLIRPLRPMKTHSRLDRLPPSG